VIAVLDFGGVVCAFRPHRRLAALAELSGIDEATIDQRIWQNGLDAAAERGELSPDDTWNGVLAALDHVADRDAVRGAWALAFEPNETILALIDSVRVPVALFTNNGPLVDDILDHELGEVAARFQHRLLSCQLGAVKPAPEAFRRAAAQLGCEPGELLLLDDSPANVAAARAQGWQAALIQAG
jgi:HAD superfamily hydrolase (TIGR01509 family)